MARASVEHAPETRVKRMQKATAGIIHRVEEMTNRLDNLKGRLLGCYDGPEPAEINKEAAPDYCDIEGLEQLLTKLDNKMDRLNMQINELENL